MWRFVAILALSGVSRAQSTQYELMGRVLPEIPVSVQLHGATFPFFASARSDGRGRFHFHKLLPGAYIVIIFAPNRVEIDRTVEVGAGTAGEKRIVSIAIHLDNETIETSRDKVSLSELSISKEAWREYDAAESALAGRDVTKAVQHLERAVAIAPKFAAAWNHLGTIAYMSGDYPKAEANFRQALIADPSSYQPLVNLGGVLINLRQYDEALKINFEAVRRRPDDALANSQLGMSYFCAPNLDLAEKYLTIAKQIDPSHFSHPQRLLAEIHIQRKENAAAIAELEDLLKRHPDLSEAPKIKELIARLRQAGP